MSRKQWIVKSKPTAVGVCALLIDLGEGFECHQLTSVLYSFSIKASLKETLLPPDTILYVIH